MSRPDLVRIELVPMTVDDFALIVDWLGDTEIRRWWDMTPDLASVEARYLPRIEGAVPTTCLVVIVAGTRVGWCQHYRVSDHADWCAAVEEAGLDALTMIGIDYSLSAGARDRGLGPLVIDHLAAEAVAARRSLPSTSVMAAPDADNLRSQRALEIAGFTRAAAIAAPDGTTEIAHVRPVDAPTLRSMLRATFDWFEQHSGWAPPPPETLADWVAEGIGRAPDDCPTSRDGPCPHGLVTWNTVLRYSR